MAGRYNSFLLRCWLTGEEDLRIRIEHVQLGHRTIVTCFEDAATWMSDRCAQDQDERPAPPTGARVATMPTRRRVNAEEFRLFNDEPPMPATSFNVVDALKSFANFSLGKTLPWLPDYRQGRLDSTIPACIHSVAPPPHTAHPGHGRFPG